MDTNQTDTQGCITPPPHRPIRSFVLREGHLSDGQQRAIDTLMPKWGIPFSEAPLNYAEVFERTAPTILEIGFGMGVATASIAATQPHHNYIGIEVHRPGVGNLLKLIDEQHLSNLRLIRHDAVEVLKTMIAPNTLDGIHIYFPDPWPKKKHHKRRLIQSPFVALLASRLKEGGYLHLATDWEEYAHQMLAVLSDEPLLKNSVEGFAPRPDWRPLTKFEARGLALGHGVWDCIFERSVTA